jgi:uncharacterized RDD family membrane protein YckC
LDPEKAPVTDQGRASGARRGAAVLIDGVAGALVALAILGPQRYSDSSFAPLVVFFAETALGTALAGGSFGQPLTRIRVLRVDGRPVSLLRALLRSLLICLVVPPLVFKPDGRGLHDLVTDSAAYRLPA